MANQQDKQNKQDINLNPPNPDLAQAQIPQHDPNEVFISLSKQDLLDIIREARHDPNVEAKLETEARRVDIRRRQMVALAKRDEEAKVARQALCRHRKPNGEETAGGQEFSDGRYRVICTRCQKILRSYWSPQIAQGMAIKERMDTLGITDDDVKRHMAVDGEGNPLSDTPDDFALGMPRGVHSPSLTT